MNTKQRESLVGNKYGRLTVIELCGEDNHNNPKWLCKCDCGKTVEVIGMSLKSGNTKSCGCYKKDRLSKFAKKKFIKHGLGNTYIYRAWRRMNESCYNPEYKDYKNYGERGITVCFKWKHSVSNFYKDIGDRPTSKHTIERIDNEGNYEPSNCKWATMAEQNRNKRTNRDYKKRYKLV